MVDGIVCLCCVNHDSGDKWKGGISPLTVRQKHEEQGT